ncbi:hypothetical protein E2C01_052491 [Portunus trituberculatus]|uniref:Secreted protein n=1 Tax=Portunus trituberculatus TaxID=210409 RepID=A0A5B7GLP5_PORTR|nr:hypothetical protein [Portunus trituberculatus]
MSRRLVHIVVMSWCIHRVVIYNYASCVSLKRDSRVLLPKLAASHSRAFPNDDEYARLPQSARVQRSYCLSQQLCNGPDLYSSKWLIF